MISMSNLAHQSSLTGSRLSTGNTTAPLRLADDLLLGAEEIAEFLFGDRSKKAVRKVFYLGNEIQAAKRPPIFKLGNHKYAARRTRMLQWIAEQEEAATAV